jgi:predicted molibdopterin-dependent oxidoreductase YjgC
MHAERTGSRFEVEVDGQRLAAQPGDTVAAVLLRAGISTFRDTRSGRPRGIFCGMGICFDCLVAIDGLNGQRACITLARPGMRIETGKAEIGK